MLGLIEFSLGQFIAALVGAFMLLGIAAGVVGYFIRGVRKEGKSLDAEVIQGLQQLCDVHREQIAQLEKGLASCQAEHEKCERKINTITALNLRLQARLKRLEVRQGIEETDSDVNEAPEDSDFR